MPEPSHGTCRDCVSHVQNHGSLCPSCLESHDRLRRQVADLQRDIAAAERAEDAANELARMCQRDCDHVRSAVCALSDALDQPAIADLLDSPDVDQFAVRQLRRALRRVLGASYGR